MAIVQKPIAIPEPINQVDSLWRTTQALKEAVEVIQGIRGNREYALQCDLEDAINPIDANDGCCTWAVEDFSGNYTLVPADSGKIKRSTGGSATDFTVAPDVFSIGEQVVVFQSGAGAVTIVAGSGVTIRTPTTLLVNEQYGSITLILLAANEWMIAGRMTP